MDDSSWSEDDIGDSDFHNYANCVNQNCLVYKNDLFSYNESCVGSFSNNEEGSNWVDHSAFFLNYETLGTTNNARSFNEKDLLIVNIINKIVNGISSDSTLVKKGDGFNNYIINGKHEQLWI